MYWILGQFTRLKCGRRSKLSMWENRNNNNKGKLMEYVSQMQFFPMCVSNSIDSYRLIKDLIFCWWYEFKRFHARMLVIVCVCPFLFILCSAVLHIFKSKNAATNLLPSETIPGKTKKKHFSTIEMRISQQIQWLPVNCAVCLNNQFYLEWI